jgi:NADPH:quinone reductase-like Zn-dependent oxidoreductase
MLLGPILTMLGNKNFGSMYSNPNNDDYVFFADLVETGKIIPVIDKTFTLSEVPEALRYFGSGDAQGKIVISMNKD